MTEIPFHYAMGMFAAAQVLHLFFWDFSNLRKSARVANVHFKPLDVVKEDWFLWVGNLILGVILYVIWVSGEAKILHSTFGDRPLTFFAVMGAFGSFSIQSKWGRLQAKIDSVVDHKTNIADGVEKRPAPVEPPLTPNT